MNKKKIDKKIVVDLSASALTTWIVAQSVIGITKSDNSLQNHPEEKKQYLIDISELFHTTAKSIEDYLVELFSKTETINNTTKNYSGQRIKSPIKDIKEYSIDEIVDIVGKDIYNNIARNNTIKKRFHKMFSAIYAQYVGLQPNIPITLELVIALPRGESAYDPRATSSTGARGLYQTIQSTFDKYFPQSKNLSLSERKRLAYDPINNSFAGISHLIYLDKFHNKNDPYYKNASTKEKQKRLIISYNIGEGLFQKSGFKLENVPNYPRPYKRDATNLSNYVLGLIYGNSYAENSKK